MIRVGFIIDFGTQWIGGLNYFRSLFSALRELPARQVEPVIFVSNSVSRDQESEFSGWEIVRSRILKSSSPASALRRGLRRISNIDFMTMSLMKRNDIDVLSHYRSLGGYSSLKTIGWIPDFQHRLLPQFFSERELRFRDKEFQLTCKNSDVVIVSSESARADLSAFCREASRKARVMHFIPQLDPVGPFTDLDSLQAKYNFVGQYLFLPNQFWAHKNHRVVIEALAVLRARGRPFLVLATGNKEDYRNPGFFSSLMDESKRLGVHDDFRALGVVPYQDMLSLMHHSTAVLNPSLCEGWSTTVEEAKALNKPLLLSDIPVHREQNNGELVYFPANNPKLLAEAILNCAISNEDAGHKITPLELSAKHKVARIAFARRYQEIVCEVTGISLAK